MTYEFSKEEETEFVELSRILTILAVLFGLYGLLGFFLSLSPFNAINMLYSLTVMVISVFFYRPTDNFRKIALTEGSDIRELMQAFNELNMGWDYVIVMFGVLSVLTFVDLFI